MGSNKLLTAVKDRECFVHLSFQDSTSLGSMVKQCVLCLLRMLTKMTLGT